MKIERLPNRAFNKRLIPELGSKIKKAREQCGLSQTELAKLIGKQASACVSLYETNDRQVSAITLWKISQVTNLPITFFL